MLLEVKIVLDVSSDKQICALEQCFGKSGHPLPPKLYQTAHTVLKYLFYMVFNFIYIP